MSLLSNSLNNQPHQGNEEGDEMPEKGFNRDCNGKYSNNHDSGSDDHDSGSNNHDSDGHGSDGSHSMPYSLGH
eukprot:4587033-Ditylum_brightwellii.AAC.1